MTGMITRPQRLEKDKTMLVKLATRIRQRMFPLPRQDHVAVRVHSPLGPLDHQRIAVTFPTGLMHPAPTTPLRSSDWLAASRDAARFHQVTVRDRSAQHG